MPRGGPPPRLPVVYFALGHAALIAALLVPALDPSSIDTWFFHPRMFAVVHLVTLGWLTHSILGATYLAAPMALRADLPAGKADGWACAAVAIGASGVVAHFWIEEYSGVAYSGGLLLLAFGFLAVRVLRSLWSAGTERPVKAVVAAAYLNLLLTATYGTLLAINKQHAFLPGRHYHDVYAHAHAGLAGWGLLMVMGVGLRMLPMFLPARPPPAKSAWALLVLVEGGVVSLFFCWMFEPALVRWAALLLAAGIAWFLALVAWMLFHRVPAPPALKRPDVGMLHALQSLAYLLLAAGTGLSIAFSSRLETGEVMVYGAFVLLGFFGQIVLGMEMRLLPMYAWLSSWTGSGYRQRPVSPHAMAVRPLQATSFALWTVGVPWLAYGLSQPDHAVVSSGAWVLLAGTLAAAASTVRVFGRAKAGSDASPDSGSTLDA